MLYTTQQRNCLLLRTYPQLYCAKGFKIVKYPIHISNNYSNMYFFRSFCETVGRHLIYLDRQKKINKDNCDNIMSLFNAMILSIGLSYQKIVTIKIRE